MPRRKQDDLDDTTIEAPGGTQATHSALPAVKPWRRVADAGASYVREKDVAEMRRDLEQGIREHPLRSIAIALVGGYVLARLLD